MFAIRLSHVNESRKIGLFLLSRGPVMPVLVAPASPTSRQSSLFGAAVERLRLRWAIEAHWRLVMDRGDPHLISDGGLVGIESSPDGWWPDPVRHSHWML
ncbi:hypothetical protein NXT3_CH03267 [Sinorhizobium fredii]|nr:hypothetical protein NXT3_CH03267 [Sinorhizobium fredii]